MTKGYTNPRLLYSTLLTRRQVSAHDVTDSDNTMIINESRTKETVIEHLASPLVGILNFHLSQIQLNIPTT